MRRGHERLAEIAVAVCPQCHESRLPHRACPHCGHYNGMQVVEVAKKKGE
jgi:large subunit ribosomal protein L32